MAGCPVCNGLVQLTANCPNCQHAVTDCLSIGELFGPYSPYEPFETVPDQLGFIHVNTCTHVANCPGCGTASYFLVHVRV